jgi:hypothetical protein
MASISCSKDFQRERDSASGSTASSTHDDPTLHLQISVTY